MATRNVGASDHRQHGHVQPQHDCWKPQAVETKDKQVAVAPDYKNLGDANLVQPGMTGISRGNALFEQGVTTRVAELSGINTTVLDFQEVLPVCPPNGDHVGGCRE
jgi:hypothetical protein